MSYKNETTCFHTFQQGNLGIKYKRYCISMYQESTRRGGTNGGTKIQLGHLLSNYSTLLGKDK